MSYPRAFSHVGISVPDIERAVQFYTEALGLYLVVPPSEINEGDDVVANVMLTEAVKPGWKRVRMAHLSTADGIGIELFEFEGAKKTGKDYRYRESGIFHFALQDPDIEQLAKRIVEHGGKQTMPVREFVPGDKPYKMVYCEDPFGNIIELYSHSYELTYSPQAAPAHAG